MNRYIPWMIVVSLLLAPAVASAQIRYQMKAFDKERGTAQLTLSYPEIQSASTEAVRSKLSEIIMGWILAPVGSDEKPARTVDDLYARFLKWHDDFTKETGTPSTWNLTRDVEVVYQTRRLVCLRSSVEGDTGGAHPYAETHYLNLRTENGQRILLKDLVREGRESELTRLAEKELRASYEIPANKPLNEAGFLVERIALTENFAITPTGLTFFYNNEITPHSMGPAAIDLPYAAVKDLLKPDLELPNR